MQISAQFWSDSIPGPCFECGVGARAWALHNNRQIVQQGPRSWGLNSFHQNIGHILNPSYEDHRSVVGGYFFATLCKFIDLKCHRSEDTEEIFSSERVFMFIIHWVFIKMIIRWSPLSVTNTNIHTHSVTLCFSASLNMSVFYQHMSKILTMLHSLS